MEQQTIKAYKAFNKELKCRGFQYEVGKEYETDAAKCCEKGFHACENPIDVFKYYPPADSRFCLVELSGKIDKDSGGRKIAATKIKICEEISLAELINAAVEFNKAHSAKGTTTQGRYANATTQGDFSCATTQGNYSNATTQGDFSCASVKSTNSIAAAFGYLSRASAPIGGAIVVAEYGKFNGICNPLIGIKSAIVDGKNLKPDTFYCLKNGEFQEVTDIGAV